MFWGDSAVCVLSTLWLDVFWCSGHIATSFLGFAWAMKAVAACVDTLSALKSASCASSCSLIASRPCVIILMVWALGHHDLGTFLSMVAGWVDSAMVSPIFNSCFLYSLMVIR